MKANQEYVKLSIVMRVNFWTRHKTIPVRILSLLKPQCLRDPFHYRLLSVEHQHLFPANYLAFSFFKFSKNQLRYRPQQQQTLRQQQQMLFAEVFCSKALASNQDVLNRKFCIRNSSQMAWVFAFIQFINQYLMLRHKLLQSYFIICLIALGLPLTLLPPQQIIAENRLLFVSAYSPLTFTNFTITYPKPLHETPIVSYALNNYHMGDRFYYQNLLTLITRVENTHFILAVYPIQSTLIYKLSIRYLAIEDKLNFVVLSRSYPNPAVVSSHSGNRSILLHESYNFSSLNVTGTLFITGFYLQSINSYYLHTLIKNVSNFGFWLEVVTFSDCTVNRLDLSFLFYYPNKISDLYIIRQDQSFCYQGLAANTVSATLTQMDTSVFLLGMSGFSGNTFNSIINFGWTPANSTNTTLTVAFNTKNLIYLCYNYIQIFEIEPSPSAPPANSTPEPSNDLIKIIIIALVCSLVVILIILCAIRCWGKSKYFQKQGLKQSKKQLSMVSLKELPAFHF